MIRKVKDKIVKKEVKSGDMTREEKQVFELVRENRAVFQADLIEKLGMNKAKVTRILDRLEGKGFLERKRRGMNNIVVVKEG